MIEDHGGHLAPGNEDETQRVPTPGGVERAHLTELDAAQLELVDALRGRSGQFNCADMYLGALRVLRDQGNPLRLVLAAHGLRELMEKLPWSYDVPAPPGSLEEPIRGLRDSWNTALSRSQCQPAEWDGAIDQPLRKVLRKLAAFFTKFTEDRPPRQVQVDEFLLRADYGLVPLPEVIRREHVQKWRECNKFFIEVAHHRQGGNDEFGQWLAFLEQFLLERLVPRTSRDRKNINELIARGEGG